MFGDRIQGSKHHPKGAVAVSVGFGFGEELESDRGEVLAGVLIMYCLFTINFLFLLLRNVIFC